jgi:hypothetical protein
MAGKGMVKSNTSTTCLAAPACEDRQCNRHADEPAVKRHASVPDPEDAERIVQQPLGAVDEHPADPAAEDHAERAHEDQVVDELGCPCRPRSRGATAREPPARHEADEIHDAVPVHRERPDRAEPRHVEWADRKRNLVGVRIDEHCARS